MQRPLRIMLVGRSGSTGPLRQRLLDANALKFTARCVSSEGDVRILAREFSPDVVVSTDTASSSSNETLAQMLTLLSRQSPRILLCEIDGRDSIWSEPMAPCPVAMRRNVTQLRYAGTCGAAGGIPRLCRRCGDRRSGRLDSRRPMPAPRIFCPNAGRNGLRARIVCMSRNSSCVSARLRARPPLFASGGAQFQWN